MERAKAEGISVRMIIVEDDCAMPEGKGITGGRGVAGTVLVHKVAGAAAAAGLSLDQVFLETQAAAVKIRTLGVAFSMCNLPGCPPSTRLAGAVFEVGMGIHGEHGREVRAFPESNAADVVADIMLEAVLRSPQDAAGLHGTFEKTPVAVMINSMGSTTLLELNVVAKRVIQSLHQRGIPAVRAYVGHFLTSLGMAGVSLSLMKVDAAILARLDAPTTAAAWTPSTELPVYPSHSSYEMAYNAEAYVVPVEGVTGGYVCPYAVQVIRNIAQRLIALETVLTAYDSACGDGDCGVVMKAGAERVLQDLANISRPEVSYPSHLLNIRMILQ